jgi:hypothetical protein
LFCTLSIHMHRFSFKHLSWHSITKILRNGPRAHFPFTHKGKATSGVTYNPKDEPEAYNNPVVHSRLTEYTPMGKEVDELYYDPRTEDNDSDSCSAHEGRRREDAWAIMDCRQGNRLILHSQHECEASHTTLARQLTASHSGTPGYSLPIRRSLIVIYLLFAVS